MLRMAHRNPSDADIKRLLEESLTIALVGASSRPDRPSHGVMKRLLDWGYRVIPVNPNEAEVWGQKSFASLEQIPVKVDVVDVFRRPEFTPEIADEAVKMGARALWLQLGVVNEQAAERAKAGGLTMIM